MECPSHEPPLLIGRRDIQIAPWQVSTCIRRDIVIRYLIKSWMVVGLISSAMAQDNTEASATLVDARAAMRDGVELSADIWLPQGSDEHPAILVRTPYTKQAGFLKPSFLGQYFADRGYAVVVQDVRGKGLSDGVFRDMEQESADGYDSVEWVAAQPWSNGRVCMMGLSYLGSVQWMAAKALPPHLTCIVPTAASPGNPFIEAPYRGGVFLLDIITWVWGNAPADVNAAATQPDWAELLMRRPLNKIDQIAGQRLWLYQDWLNHPTMDEYWESVMVLPQDFQKIDIPTLSITGWFDDALIGTVYGYRGMASSRSAADRHLIIGPWNHIQTFVGGDTSIRGMELSEDSILDMREVTLAFLERYLMARDTASEVPKVRVYITGENRWHYLDQYPPEDSRVRRLYLRSQGNANTSDGDGLLSSQPPGNEPPDRFRFDPEMPAPVHPDNAYMDWNLGDGQIADLDRRQDVLTYTSEPLKEPLTVLGPVSMVLHAATDSKDTDFVVRLLDVRPDGTVLKPSLSDGAIRARYRNGFDEQVLLTPNRPERYEIEMFDYGHQFAKGSRIRIQLTSSSYPALHPNPNTGNPIASDTEFRIAEQTIFHSADRTSYLILPEYGKAK